MISTEIQRTFDAAFVHHQGGQFPQAETMYTRVLAAEPMHADALHLLGVLALQTGRLDRAGELIGRAIAIKPAASYYEHLGIVQASAGKLNEAIASYQRALDLSPESPEAYCNLGSALKQAGMVTEAIGAYTAAIELRAEFPEAFNNLGLALLDAGRIGEAISAFSRATLLRSGDPQAWNNLGSALRRSGECAEAVRVFGRAIAIDPAYADAHNNLGSAHQQLGDAAAAMAEFQKALSIQQQFPEAMNNLAMVLQGRGKLDEAIKLYRAAIALKPDFAPACLNLALALQAKGDTDEALTACQRAVALQPAFGEACNTLGVLLQSCGELRESAGAFRQAIAANADSPQAHCNLGNVLRQTGHLADAIQSYRRAIALRPEYADAYNNLGHALQQAGDMDAAIASFQRALQIAPNLAEAYNNLGNVRKEQGELDEAIACYARAASLNGGDASADSNRVYTLQFHPAYDARAILREHLRWARRHALASQFPSGLLASASGAASGRKFRIGYVSPDFRDHCQAFFTVPLFTHHDRERFEIFCYSDVAAPDAITARLRAGIDTWRNIVGQSDERVAEQIRQDKIDVLVDLTMHMAHNRLLVFAQKPAPVQVSWLAYPGTTGLSAIDYRLSDPYLDPADANLSVYSEKTLRLPDSFWCYDPLTTEPAVNELPAVKNGFITFGCLNNFCKINDGTLALWARVMNAAPDSRLLLLAPRGAARERVLNKLGTGGIEPTRITFADRRPRRLYLELYQHIDIGLDTFPYNGHTTSLDSFWMGVPVVTQIGQTLVGRGGWSQLCNLGLPELAGKSAEEFVQIATGLPENVERLRALRKTLRDRLTRSPLMDAPRFARGIESAYRAMWEECAVNLPARTLAA